MTTFTIHGAPATKGSTLSFVGKDGRVVTKADCRRLKDWEVAVGWAARAARVPLVPIHLPVCVCASFQFVRPKSAATRACPTVKPDLDKMSRALLDALTGVAFVDD